jgi:integrase
MRTKQGGSLMTATGRASFKQRREPYWVVITRGCALGYRKGAKGGTWIARSRRDDGRQQYQSIGPADDLNDGQGIGYEAAQDAARKFCKAEPATGKATVADALDGYLTYIQANNPESTANDTKARIDGILKPEFGKILLSKLRSTDITRWRDKAAKKRKKDTVNRLLTILKAALNYAWQEMKLVESDTQWRMVKRFKDAGAARKIFLTPAQARALLSHCTPDAFRDLVQAALLTGARYGELTALRVQHFDPTTSTLDVIDGKTGDRTVYLQAEALPFFKRLAADKPADSLLLPREDGEQWGKNHHQKPFDKALKAANLDANTTFYALRHSYISLALLAGVNIKVLADNTGTSVRMIEQHYAKFLDKDRRAMFNRMKGFVPAKSEPVKV